MPKTARYAKPFTIGTAEEKLLQAVAKYHYLTAPQATRLLYKPGTLKYVMEKLATLAAHEYVLRLYLPRLSARGSEKSVYTLATKGRRYVYELGMDIDIRSRPAEEHEKSLFFLRHTLAVNDWLIAAQKLTQTVPHIVIKQMLHERELRREPVYVDVPVPAGDNQTKKVRTGIIPDGMLEFHIKQAWRDFIALEIDRGHIEEKRWKHKVRSYCAYTKGTHKNVYGTNVLTIAVVATPGDIRRDMFKDWTEEELSRIGETAEGERFLFTSLDAGQVPPEAVFLQPYWYQAFRQQPIQLVMLEEESA